MASSSNGNGNLMDEFEEAFQACLHALTKQESNTGVSKDEVEFEVQATANKFIDVARQMEAFFLQKRFVISALKPEMLLKDENQELKSEIARKEQLINKHYSRLEEWKALLSDQQQQQGYNKQAQSQPDMRSINSNPGGIPQTASNQMGMVGGGGGGIPGSLQAQLQQQQHLQVQQQQQHQQQMLQAQQMQQMQQMQVGAQQQLYMQQGGQVGGRGAFNQGANVLQGPLAYLEKTTSNIDLVGMGDGRR